MKVKQLKIFLALMSLIHVRRPKIAIQESIRLVNESLIYTDFDSLLRIDFPHDVDGIIPFERFKKLILSLDGDDEIGFSQELSKGHIYVKINGRIEAKFQFHGNDDYPSLPPESISKEIGIISASVISGLNEALSFTGSDDFRPVMKYVGLDDHVVATDGRILFFREISRKYSNYGLSVPTKVDLQVSREDTLESENSPILFSRTTIQILVKSGLEFQGYIKYFQGSGKTGNETAFNGLFIELKASGIQILQRCMAERFPDWRNVVPNFKDNEHLSISVDRYGFEKGVRLASVQANATTKAIRLKTGKNELQINSKDHEFGSAFHKKLPCVFHSFISKPIPVLTDQGSQEPDESFEMGFNAELLLKVMKPLKTDQILIQADSPTSAAIINREYLIMPLMLKNETEES